MASGGNLLGNIGAWTQDEHGSYRNDASFVAQRSGAPPSGDTAQPANTEHGEYSWSDLETAYGYFPAGLTPRPDVPTLGAAADSAMRTTRALLLPPSRRVQRIRRTARRNTPGLNADVRKCRECGKECANAATLKRHLRVHDPDKNGQHRCRECGTGFLYPKDARRCAEKDLGTRFECQQPNCDRTFTRRDNMRRHFRKEHLSSPDPLASHHLQEPYLPPESQTTALEANSMVSMLAQPDPEAPQYQEEFLTEPTNPQPCPEHGPSYYLQSEQTTGSFLNPYVSLQQLDMRNSYSRHKPVDLLRNSAAGDDDDYDPALTGFHVRPRYRFS